MDASGILNLFELIRESPDEYWAYNKSRLLEILDDFRRENNDLYQVEGKVIPIERITEEVVLALEKINHKNSPGEILVDRQIRHQFQEILSRQLQGKSIQQSMNGASIMPEIRLRKIV